MKCIHCKTSEAEIKKPRICRPCKQLYDRNYYHSNIDKIKPRKRATRKQIRLETYKKLKEYCETHPCEECGESDFAVLDFDHVDKNNKKLEISNMVRSGSSFSKIEEEIKKCRVLCANCHRRRTAKQFNWYI